MNGVDKIKLHVLSLIETASLNYASIRRKSPFLFFLWHADGPVIGRNWLAGDEGGAVTMTQDISIK